MVFLRRDESLGGAYRAAARSGLAILIVASGLARASERPVPRGRDAQGQQQAAAKELQDASGYSEGQRAPFVVQIKPTKDQTADAREEHDERQGNAVREWWLVGFTAALTAATITLGLFTALLWHYTRKLWKSGERSIIEQNRPWVFVDRVIWETDKDFITVVFRNSGVRPAKSFRKEVICHDLPMPFPSSDAPDITDGAATFLPPGASESMTLKKPARMDEGREYRIRIALDYLVDGELRDRLDVDFACDNDGAIRKATPRDYAYYHGGPNNYTFDLKGQPLE